MASLPAGSCCYQGVKHEGEAKGSFSQLNDFEIYTSSPADKSTENGVLVYVLPSIISSIDLAGAQMAHNVLSTEAVADGTDFLIDVRFHF